MLHFTDPQLLTSLAGSLGLRRFWYPFPLELHLSQHLNFHWIAHVLILMYFACVIAVLYSYFIKKHNPDLIYHVYHTIIFI